MGWWWGGGGVCFGAQQWRIQGESPGKIPKPLIVYTNHAVIDRLVVNKPICD